MTFLPALGNEFVNFDDRANLLENPMFRGFGPEQLRWMATTFHLGHWQPLSWLSFALDHRLWGLAPAGYHLTNLTLHAASAAVLLVLASRLLARAGIDGPECLMGATVAALVWAIHPLRVESVAWATERRDVLSGLFTLLALLAACGRSSAPPPVASQQARSHIASVLVSKSPSAWPSATR